jgi:hypothetical protein
LARLGDGNDKTYIFYYYDNETKFTRQKDKSNIALHERGITYSALGFHYNGETTYAAKEIVDRTKTIDFNDYSQFPDLTNQHGNEWKPPYIPSYNRDSYDHGIEEMHIDSVFYNDFTRFFENEDHNFKPNGYPLGEGNPRIKAKVTFDGQTVEDFNKLALLKILYQFANIPPKMANYMKRLELTMRDGNLAISGLPVEDLRRIQAAREATQALLTR